MLPALSKWIAIACLTAPVLAGEAEFTWKGKPYKASSIPDAIPPAAQATLRAWIPFAREKGYRLDFDGQGRVLLITSEKSSASKDQLALVSKTETWFDTLLPAPQRAADSGSDKGKETTAPKKKPALDLREDPEAPPEAAKKAGEKKTPANQPAKSWGSGNLKPDTQTGVLFVFSSKDDYLAALDVIAKENSQLKGWTEKAASQTGFAIELPLAAGFYHDDVQEEWDGDHELINRLTQMLTLRRFGQQPFWLVNALAWEAEMDHDRMVYCFPYRDEFVYTAEHGAWPIELKAVLKDKEKKAIQADDFATWKRGSWSKSHAQTAWGVVHYLAAQPELAKNLPAFLEEQRVIQDKENRRQTDSGKWERIEGWEIAPERQIELMNKHFGDDFLAKARAWLMTKESAKASSEKQQSIKPR